MTRVHSIEVPIPFPLKSVNCYYIEDSTPTLIDAGVHTDEAMRAVESAIEATGARVEDLNRIVLTHCHLDHMGLAGRIMDRSGADLFVHPEDNAKLIRDLVEEFDRRGPMYRSFFLEAGVPFAY